MSFNSLRLLYKSGTNLKHKPHFTNSRYEQLETLESF